MSQPAAEVQAMLEGARPGCPLSPSLSWGLGSPSRGNSSQLALSDRFCPGSSCFLSFPSRVTHMGNNNPENQVRAGWDFFSANLSSLHWTLFDSEPLCPHPPSTHPHPGRGHRFLRPPCPCRLPGPPHPPALPSAVASTGAFTQLPSWESTSLPSLPSHPGQRLRNFSERQSPLESSGPSPESDAVGLVDPCLRNKLGERLVLQDSTCPLGGPPW